MGSQWWTVESGKCPIACRVQSWRGHCRRDKCKICIWWCRPWCRIFHSAFKVALKMRLKGASSLAACIIDQSSNHKSKRTVYLAAVRRSLTKDDRKCTECRTRKRHLRWRSSSCGLVEVMMSVWTQKSSLQSLGPTTGCKLPSPLPAWIYILFLAPV